MLHFQSFIYANMGAQIKNHRKNNLQLTQEKFIGFISDKYHYSLDRQRLSSIENGRCSSKKNPYLLSDEQLDIFLDILKLDKSTFIFGDSHTQENFIKLTLLLILINGSKDRAGKDFLIPFVKKVDNLEYYNASDKVHLIYLARSDKIEATKVKESIIHLKDIHASIDKHFPFFSSKELVSTYSMLIDEPSTDFTVPSNLLIKLLFGDLSFAIDFIKRFTILHRNRENLIPTVHSFLLNEGSYGGLATDWCQFSFILFTTAFDELWNRHKQEFITFFKDNLFTLEREKNILWKLTDANFNNLLTSSEFNSFLQNILTIDEYHSETMIGHNHVRSALQAGLMINTKTGTMGDPTSKVYNISQLQSDMTQLTNLLERISTDAASPHNVPLYAAQYTHIKKMFE